ncbi:hypothetical protein CAEBREN_15931 [Caenorhabditis brenneri]|uniref:Serpentine receptor class gamma n=1 Tax=Caenorhabditis brenneri TaxID=135651 RepID=G0PHC8_CAEBE|nr:hypothetical protein CAEBREN_15931 [Caenorhabditis brenneri]
MDLVLNLFCWINNWPNRMLFREDGVEYILPIYENFNVALHISYYIMNVFLHIQSFSSITVCIHRLSTATFENSNMFWSKYFLLVYLIILVYSSLATQLINLNKIEFDYQLRAFYPAPLTDVTFSMAYILLIFDGNVRSAIRDKIPFTIMRETRVPDVRSTHYNSSRVGVV